MYTSVMCDNDPFGPSHLESVSLSVLWGLHGHMFRKHVGDVVPGVTVQTLFQPLLVQVVAFG